jgi:hypothetical protein
VERMAHAADDEVTQVRRVIKRSTLVKIEIK